jgi:hypothetical protein
MAGLARLRERTISFYELVAERDGRQQRISQLPWPETLAAISTVKVSERTFEAEHTFVGNVVTYQEEDHLLLHRVKDGGEWLSVVNWDTGDWHELELRAGEGYLDTSVMCFLPFGNVVAIMQGSLAAPSHRSLQTWLNGLHFFPSTRLVVRPLVSRAQVEKLRRAEGASRVEIRIGRSKIEALRDHHGRLARMLRTAGEEYGDIDVTMIISIPRGRTRDEDRQRLLDDLRDVDDVVPGIAERARATLVYADQSGPEYRQLVELVEHHITAKRRVSAVNNEGDSIRISSAVSVILDAAAQHEPELRLAVEAPEA